MSSRPAIRLAADPRFERGMAAQLEQRRRRLAAGERSLGWKVGFGSPEALSAFEIAGPLIGFMTDRSLIDRDAPPSLAAWKNPILEPEVAVTLGSDLPGGADREACAAAIETVAPAFELVDVAPAPEDVELVLAGNIFHRGVALGAASPSAAPAELRARVSSPARGEEVVDRPQLLTGELADVVGHVADLLAELQLALRAGEVVICGSIVPPIGVATGDRVEYRLEPVGEIGIGF